MRYSSFVLVALAATQVASTTWFSKSAYSKWHEQELERWLTDHDIPYAASANRKELESLVEKNWNDYVVAPYNSWSVEQLTSYIQTKGVQAKEGVKEGAQASKDSLLSQVQASWYETEDKAQQAYLSVKDWIFDSWSDSQLKAFCDKNGIPVPQPHKRDTLLQKARTGYETAAKNAGDTLAYPGNWLYQTWTDSDLKAWLESHGYYTPKLNTREKLIGSVRKNSRFAYLKLQDKASNAADSATNLAHSTYAALTDKVIDAWSESSLKEFCDKNGIPVPQGTKLNELRALVRKERARVLGDTVASSASSAFGAATTAAGNQYNAAKDSASAVAQDAWSKAVDTWSESQMKAYLDARGVPVPHASKLDAMRALVRKNQHKAMSGWKAWTYDDLTVHNLRLYVSSVLDSFISRVKSIVYGFFNSAKPTRKIEL